MKNVVADIVVYGKIYTSEDGKIVEAFAVKDGKFIYVGDKNGVEKFIEEGKRNRGNVCIWVRLAIFKI